MKTTLAALAGLLFLASDARSCTCFKELSVRKSVRAADAVFVGRVLTVEPLACDSDRRGCSRAAQATLEASRAWKGVEPSLRVVKVFLPDPEACGLELEVGATYLIFAGVSPPPNLASGFGSVSGGSTLTVSRCSRSGLLSESLEELEALGVPAWRISAP